MFDFNYLLSMLEELIQAALRAGCEIMKIYNSPETDWQVERKADNSPLTLADRRSHDVIAEALAASPFPMLSEEGEIPPTRSGVVGQDCGLSIRWMEPRSS